MTIGDIRTARVDQLGLQKVPSPEGFGPLWESYASLDGGVQGYYHVCEPADEWSIHIHNFTLEKDTMVTLDLPEYLSISWYDSISGEELMPHRRMRPKALCGHYGDKGSWRAIIHGGVPVRAIEVAVTPQLSARYLQKGYAARFEHVKDAFHSVNEASSFSEMRVLLTSLVPRPGDEGKTELFYKAKVLEALGLLAERILASREKGQSRLREEDSERIRSVLAHIDDHLAEEMRIAELSRIACMSPTKFKKSFRVETGHSVTEYLQTRRVRQAESLLRSTDLTVAQAAKAVGCSCGGRFAALFLRETGMLPSECKKGPKKG